MKYKEITLMCGCLRLVSYDQGKTWLFNNIDVKLPDKWELVCKKCKKEVIKTEKIVEAIKE